MNIFYKIFKTNIKHLIAMSLLIIGVIYSPMSFAGDSSYIGPGNGTSFTLSCNKTQRVSGIEVFDGAAGIEKVRARCTTYSNNGRWANSQHTFTRWTRYSSHFTDFGRIIFIDDLGCLDHRWVAAIEGRHAFLQGVAVNSLLSIKYSCFRGDENGTRSGQETEVSPGSQDTGRQTRASCPQNEIAFAISGTIFENRQITSLKLKCKIKQVTPTGTPTPISPGSPSTREISAGIKEFHFQPVNFATHYRVRILTDSRSPRSWFDQILGGRLLFSNSVNDSYVKIRIPNNKIGTVAKWKVMACNKDKICGPWSELKRFSIVPGV